MFRMGYVGQNLSLGLTTGHTFRLASLSAARLAEAARANLASLAQIARWNRAHSIDLFRMASGIIPFASHPRCDVAWPELLADDLADAAAALRSCDTRLSTHPGQYTVLTSSRAEVVAASIAELAYHGLLFELLGLGVACRIVLHVGGAEGDRRAAARRFVDHARQLPPAALARLSLEGDERTFTVSETAAIAAELGAPVIVDNLHHRLNPDGLSLAEAIALARTTWRPEHGPQKVHLSSQRAGARPGAHADTIDPADWDELRAAAPAGADVMVEAKAKERAVLALIEGAPA